VVSRPAGSGGALGVGYTGVTWPEPDLISVGIAVQTLKPRRNIASNAVAVEPIIERFEAPGRHSVPQRPTDVCVGCAPLGGGAEGAPSRLDKATLTVSGGTESCGRWRLTLHRDAGEATITPVGSAPGPREVSAEAADPERSERESRRRARASLRRFCASHRLDRMGTLTFAEEPADLDAGWERIEGFRRRLRDAIGQNVPLAIVPEYGGKNGRLHFHFAFGQYLDKATVERCWGHGWVDLRRLRPKGSRNSSARAMAREVASYLAGYVTKGDQVGHGRRRYSVTKGMAPAVESAQFMTLAAAFRAARRALVNVTAEWSSSDSDGWLLPPVYLLQGDGG